jgi:CheY-like chemotaxis protein
MRGHPPREGSAAPAAQVFLHRVLVAEDDPTFRDMIAATLRADGHEVTAVGDGIDLLDALGTSLLPGCATGSYDLVLSDVRMPGWSGLEALASLRQEPTAPPVVFITAFADEDLVNRARRAGALAVVSKPVDLDELRLLVSGLLRYRLH